jgi:hypothetical protein
MSFIGGCIVVHATGNLPSGGQSGMNSRFLLLPSRLHLFCNNIWD